MMKNIIQSCLLTTAALSSLVALHSFSQEDSNSQNYSNIQEVEFSPYSLESRSNYKAGIKKCRAALISPSWILTAKHCLGSKKENNIEKHGWVNLSYIDEGGEWHPVKYHAKAIFRHPYKDIGLMQLSEPVTEPQIEPALLLSTPIKKGHGRFNMKKVSGNVFHDIPVRAGRKNNAFVSKPDRRGKAGSSGSPWVLESETVGDVIFAVTHGSGRAPQVAYVKDWIDGTVKENEPSAELYWVTLSTLFPERFFN
ncbi:MAG: trypsin-like serine protease [Alteromonadales bacterium]|nr:trypsin-like serine protease [Alteromonadales bacterium]MCP4989091.1 trypsin-like serine protease [Colwellia sp.]